MGRRAKPNKVKAEAKRPLARESPKADAPRVPELEARLADALEERVALSEILRVISQSPTDAQPVFDTIVAHALRLCDAPGSGVYRFDGELIHVAALRNIDPAGVDAVRQAYPMPPTRGGATGRAILTRDVVYIRDVGEDPEYQLHSTAAAVGYRSIMSVPMLRGQNAIGAITVNAADVAAFSDNHVKLLQAFADQAVIAIENVRLFTELQTRNRDVTEVLDQQTATAEILRVISSSPTDVQPVFETIASNAVRLCEGLFSGVYTFDGELMRLVAQHNLTPDALKAMEALYPARPGRETAGGRAILDRTVVQIEDVLSDPDYGRDLQSTGGWRSTIAVPMLREGMPIGAISVAWAEPGPASASNIALLKTFADQAVIAIENVRLFTELEARTAELTLSVGELKALGEVGQAVSSTLDLQTVLDTIVARAVQLSGTGGGFIYEYDDATQEFHLRATHQVEGELAEALRVEPIRLGEGATGRAAATRAPVQITDALDEREYSFTRIRSILARLGYRSILAVPLLLEQRILGALVVQRRESGTFAPEVVNLLQTFATQSALAIQNARLFREIEEKSRELAAASRHKSEFLANMSHELRTPLNAIIGFSEILAEKMFGDINEKQTEYLQDILESGRHLLSLINDILDLSKIEAGRMELELSEFDLPNAIENALILVRERAIRREIKLASTIDERLGMIGGDERKVKQVLLNLLSNALKFTPEGGRIDVRAWVHDKVAEVSVTDTGVGIAREDQEAVFEEFRQVGTADKKVEGTGLGLALSRKFIELHGGRIWVTSAVGVGSTFSFTLPVRREE